MEPADPGGVTAPSRLDERRLSRGEPSPGGRRATVSVGRYSPSSQTLLMWERKRRRPCDICPGRSAHDLLVLGAGGRPLPVQGRRSTFHGKRAWTGSCNSDFDLYLVLDISSSMKSNWLDVYTFVEDLVNRFKNPKLRMSILCSTEGTTLMPLTSDRDKIELSLGDLKNIRPKGATNMGNGFKRANEQIVRASQGGKMVSSMIIAFTDGTLEPKPYEETKYEAQRARLMGAIVYAVGVKDYDQSQLEGFADTKDHVFGVTGGFSALQGITDRLAEKSCVYLASVGPSPACVGGEYTVVVRGSGLQNTRGKRSVICRFTFSDGTSFSTTATSVDEKAIVCSEVKLEEAGKEIFIEISLNEGKTFFSNNLKLTSQQCAQKKPPPPPPPPCEEEQCGPQCCMTAHSCRCLWHMEGRCLSAPVRNPSMLTACAQSLHLPPCRVQSPFPICLHSCHSPPPYSESSTTLPLIPPSSQELPACPV